MKNRNSQNKILGGGEPPRKAGWACLPVGRAKEFYFGCFVFFLVVFFLLFIPAMQAQVIGNLDFLKGLVPCGTSYAQTPCTVCHFYVLLQNIINFLLITSASLVTLMAIYVAYLFLFSGGSPKIIEDAKKKSWLLVWGTVWVLISWLVLDTIINVFANPEVFPKPWNQVSCEIEQPPPPGPGGGEEAFEPGGEGIETPFEPGGGTFGGGGASGGWEESQPEAIERLDNDPYEDGVDTGTDGYKQLNEEIDGLEQVDPALPYTAIDPISPTVNQEVEQVNTGSVVNKNLIKAIVQAESSGNPNATHLDKDGQSSYGLMQVRPDTAKIYDSSLIGLTNAQIGERLKDPDYNIQIGTAHLQDLSAKYNGDLDKVIAGYNGGPGANGPSRNCSGSLRWQCEWDNNEHTVPNTGYAVTRKYVTKVKQYYSQVNQ